MMSQINNNGLHKRLKKFISFNKNIFANITIKKEKNKFIK